MDARTRVLITALTVSILWYGAPPLQADEATDQYAVAAAHYAAHRWDLAATEFRTLLDRFPQSARANEARYFLGESLVQSGHFRQAAEVFGQLVDRKPEPQIARRTLFRQGEALHLAGDAASAEPVLRMYLQQYSDDPSAVHALCYHGAALLTLHKPAEAQKRFDEALARTSAGNLAEMCQLGKAQAAEQLKYYDEAARGYEPLLAAKSQSIAQQARMRLGMLQSSRGQFASAVATLKPLAEGVTDNPSREEARYWMALSLLQAGHSESAIDILRPWADQTGSRANEAAEAMARHFAQTGKHRDAIWILQSRLGDGRRDDEGDRRRRYLLALSFTAERRNEEALRELDLVLKSSDPELKARGLQSQGTILMTLGRHCEAIAPLVSGLELRPVGKEAIACRNHLAVCYARSGRLAEAREVYHQLQKTPQDPFLAATTLALADAAQKGDQKTWAESLWQLLGSSEAPTELRTQALYELARSQLLGNRPKDSNATCEKLFRLNPIAPLADQARLVQGAALENLGRKEEALTVYRAILTQPDSESLSSALMRAARLEEGLGQRDNAIELYDRIASQFPRSADADAAIYQAAWLLQATQRDSEALEHFRELNQAYPESRYWADATYRLTAAALKANQHDAVRCLVTSLTEAKNTPPEVMAHALLLETQRAVAEGNWSDVETSAHELITRLPQSKLKPVAEYWLAEAAYRQLRTDEAARRFNDLAKQNLQGRESWRALVPLRQGQLAAAARDWPTARAMVEQLQRDWPKCEQQQEVDYLCGRCLSAEARFDEARQAYARVTGSSGQDKTETAAMAQWMIGESYLHQQRHDEAIREFLRVEALYAYPKWQAAALLEAGKCYESSGRPAEASEIYKRILEKYGQTMFCDEARQRLRADVSTKPAGVSASKESASVTPAASENNAPSSGPVPREAAVPSTSQGRIPQR
ncbi:MAG: tetratricopeptide repeat protein [Planctomycetes bacterium]|nr:tetratricopeptide repeat protein [Planctomycetota bacterium]